MRRQNLSLLSLLTTFFRKLLNLGFSVGELVDQPPPLAALELDPVERVEPDSESGVDPASATRESSVDAKDASDSGEGVCT